MKKLHGTTIICVRTDKEVAIGGDGQVSQGDKVIKNNAVKAVIPGTKNIGQLKSNAKASLHID